MKCVIVMYDSLNRHLLAPYGCDWTHTPNFQRLAERAVTFDNNYVGSLATIPARRELHTGRYNFLHRCWGPLEVFDDSAPAILRDAGVHTHLISDNYHYWEDGGATYHGRYSSWENTRGQEGDPWKAVCGGVPLPETLNGRTTVKRRQDTINRLYMTSPAAQSQGQTFGLGCEFLDVNYDADNWFLHIETFDPHEPFFSHQQFKDLFPHNYDGPLFDWIGYHQVRDDERHLLEHIQCEYAALLAFCDHSLGRVLDAFDRYNLWNDTMLIVNTDHGLNLGAHGWWAKGAKALYREIIHTPLLVWDPRSGVQNERRKSMTQTIDLAPTLLDFFGQEPTDDMMGRPLAATIADDTPIREAGLFGLHGAHVGVADGRYVYKRAAVTDDGGPLYNYGLMTGFHPGSKHVSYDMFQNIEIVDPLPFTKGCQVMRFGAHAQSFDDVPFQHELYDLAADPGQESLLDDAEVETKMVEHLQRLMKETDAPEEQYVRLGLE